MELRTEIFLEVAPKWQHKFDEIPNEFGTEFNRAYDAVVGLHGISGKDNIKREVIKLLAVLLRSYSRTKSHTKTGSVLRKIAGFGAFFVSLFKSQKP